MSLSNEENGQPKEQTTKPQSTKLETTTRIERAIELISCNPKTTAIVRVLCTEFGVQVSSAYTILKMARERLWEDSKQDRQHYIAEAIAFYRSVFCDPEQRMADRLKALDGLRKLLGLDAPIKQQVEISSLSKYTDAELKDFARKCGIPDS